MKTVIDAVNEFKGFFNIEQQDDDENFILEVIKEPNDEHIGDLRYGHTGYSKEYRRKVCTEKEFNQEVDDMSNNKGWKNTMSTVKEEFEFTDMSDNHTITSKHVLCCADTGRVVAVFYNERDLMAATGLSKKVKLVDGKAYQFECEMLDDGDYCQGIYRKMNNKFYNYNGDFGVEYCTNIKLLEVK